MAAGGPAGRPPLCVTADRLHQTAKAKRESRVLPLDLPAPEACVAVRELVLGDAQLTETHLAALLEAPWVGLTSVDLSRNYIRALPPAEVWSGVATLEHLDLSHNSVKRLPERFAAAVPLLTTLNLRSNALRAQVQWEAEIQGLPQLQRLDLRYNPKLKAEQVAALAASVPTLTQLHSGDWDSDMEEHIGPERLKPFGDLGNNEHSATSGSAPDAAGESAAHPVPPSAAVGEPRDQTLWPSLREQLEPLSTPELRARLFDTFEIEVPIRGGPQREELMAMVLECYSRVNAAAQSSGDAQRDPGKFARPSFNVSGPELPSSLTEPLLHELRRTEWPQERPKVCSAGYLVLERDPADTRRGRASRSKKDRHSALWAAADAVISHLDPGFDFTAVALTRGFRGSPHIDRLDTAQQWVLSLGEWTPEDGGALCIEATPNSVAVINTHHRPVLVDGRFPHWVSPWDGSDRFSVVWFRTGGVPTPLQRYRPAGRADDGVTPSVGV